MLTISAHEVRPEDIGLITVKGDTENQPFMVAFLKTSNQIKVRTRRDVKSKAKRIKKSDYSSVMSRNMQGAYDTVIIFNKFK